MLYINGVGNTDSNLVNSFLLDLRSVVSSYDIETLYYECVILYRKQNCTRNSRMSLSTFTFDTFDKKYSQVEPLH